MAERNCKNCFHYNACREVASHNGYADISYTESQCKHFVLATDVVKVVRCRECEYWVADDIGRRYCELTDCWAGDTEYCSTGQRRVK